MGGGVFCSRGEWEEEILYKHHRSCFYMALWNSVIDVEYCTNTTLIVHSMQLPTSVSPNDRGGDEDEPPVDSFLAGGRGGGCMCVRERENEG